MSLPLTVSDAFWKDWLEQVGLLAAVTICLELGVWHEATSDLRVRSNRWGVMESHLTASLLVNCHNVHLYGPTSGITDLRFLNSISTGIHARLFRVLDGLLLVISWLLSRHPDGWDHLLIFEGLGMLLRGVILWFVLLLHFARYTYRYYNIIN